MNTHFEIEKQKLMIEEDNTARHSINEGKELNDL